MQLHHLVAMLSCLAATGFAVPRIIKWCVISDLELLKCNDLVKRSPIFVCEKRQSPTACITAIKAGELDATTLSGDYIYKAGLRNNDLVPIIAEVYGSADPRACSYSVAVAVKDTQFGLNQLGGKKSCHAGLRTSEGWVLPIGTLLSKGLMNWEGADTHSLLQAVSNFFSASCVPGASGYHNLCQLCKPDCSESPANQYYGNAGALRCLAEDAGQVAFMNPSSISESSNYELLCQDNSRAPVENYKTCNLGEEPAHAVVTRKDKELAKLIWTSLTSVTEFDLFSSATYGSKDLMFSDSAVRLKEVPPGTDSFLYLGGQYTDKLQSLLRAQNEDQDKTGIRWCAVGDASGPELAKCYSWSQFSSTADGISAITCQVAPTVEDCFKRIMKQEADAIAVDGGQVYTAGKCGLVPVMVEQYDEGKCSSTGGALASSYHSVAVIKKGSGVTWGNLKGKRSCHTGMGRTAGWNIPMGHIHKTINSCDFTQYFSSGCAPGADPLSPFCRNCKGSGKTVDDEHSKCKASAEELYYGYAGAFRCLVEGAGDVAFIKHTIIGENTNGNGPVWASGLRSEDFELICPGKDGPVPVSDYESCNLAVVPAHAVVTRTDIRNEVLRVLKNQQDQFGPNGSDSRFKMFQSTDGKNLLFKDSTKCLQEILTGSYETFLGPDYITAMESLRQCSDNTPDLEKSCAFQSCH